MERDENAREKEREALTRNVHKAVVLNLNTCKPVGVREDDLVLRVVLDHNSIFRDTVDYAIKNYNILVPRCRRVGCGAQSQHLLPDAADFQCYKFVRKIECGKIECRI